MACIFREWYMQPISRQNRAEKVLRLMRIWMRRAFESGVQRRSVECCFQQWKVEAGLDHPGMVHSSSEEIQPAMSGNDSTSSSDSDDTLPVRFVSPVPKTHGTNGSITDILDSIVYVAVHLRVKTPMVVRNATTDGG